MVVDDERAAAGIVAAAQPAGPPSSRQPSPPPRSTGHPPRPSMPYAGSARPGPPPLRYANPQRPAPQRRTYRSPAIRWIARRPPETIPPRRPARPSGPRLIPRYVYLPTWGLRDQPITELRAGDPVAVAQSRLHMALLATGGILAVSGLVHILRYILLTMNRSRPIPTWLADLSGALVVTAGALAVVAFVVATVLFVRWVIEVRTESYAMADRLDPRRRRWLIPLAAIPLVNIIGGPLLVYEAAMVRTDVDRDVVRRRINRLWVAWAIVNGVAIVTVVARLYAWQSGSIQSGANALTMVIISAVVSAAFAIWAASRLPRLFAGPETATVPDRRWVAVA
ncbi:DUF4328 domain-containing protein [Gordonia bronchialis]|nr:DUF4328 domain-containing protein [Gordonia bronchialis]